MQTACYWQFCFSDRFTGARNPARLSHRDSIPSNPLRPLYLFDYSRMGWDAGGQCLNCSVAGLELQSELFPHGRINRRQARIPCPCAIQRPFDRKVESPANPANIGSLADDIGSRRLERLQTQAVPRCPGRVPVDSTAEPHSTLKSSDKATVSSPALRAIACSAGAPPEWYSQARFATGSTTQQNGTPNS